MPIVGGIQSIDCLGVLEKPEKILSNIFFNFQRPDRSDIVRDTHCENIVRAF